MQDFQTEIETWSISNGPGDEHKANQIKIEGHIF